MDVFGRPVKNIEEFYLKSKKMRWDVLPKKFLNKCKMYGVFP